MSHSSEKLNQPEVRQYVEERCAYHRLPTQGPLEKSRQGQNRREANSGKVTKKGTKVGLIRRKHSQLHGLQYVTSGVVSGLL